MRPNLALLLWPEVNSHLSCPFFWQNIYIFFLWGLCHPHMGKQHPQNTAIYHLTVLFLYTKRHLVKDFILPIVFTCMNS